jgi:cell division protease FtsH
MNPKSGQRWVTIALTASWVLLALYFLLARAAPGREIPYSEFRTAVAAGKVAEVAISATLIQGQMKDEAGAKPPAPVWPDPRRFTTVRIDDPDLLRDLMARDVKIVGIADNPFWQNVLSWLMPVALMLGLWWLVMSRLGQGPSGVMAVGRSKAKIYMEREVNVTFADVAGVDEAKQELQEVIEFLRTPEKFRRLGGKIPKGILLVGPPGTGKTLLARAVAGEAGVPFFSINGSEFVELFVGVGAARVRDLFLQAKEKAPCIIFIDELDALGKARGVGPLPHEEREQTLNQLLVEMDGFDPHAGVILMAATNRPEILDPALLRAGRFDRHVLVDRPDKAGRLAILRLHARGVSLAPDADLEVIASITAGFVGADLANIVNEAALLAVRRNREAVELSDLQEAVERVIAGLEKKNRVLNPMEKERVAHHEVGHALASLLLPDGTAVQKISIIPRGIAALGYTLQLPTEDRFLMTRAELENKVAVLLAGRAAEEIVYHDTSTGAQDDFRKATDIARAMVRVYGMSEQLGQISFDRNHQPLLTPALAPSPRGDYSEHTARAIDRAVRQIIDEQYARVRTLLATEQAVLREAARSLLVKETMSGEELRAILAQRHERAA